MVKIAKSFKKIKSHNTWQNEWNLKKKRKETKKEETAENQRRA